MTFNPLILERELFFLPNYVAIDDTVKFFFAKIYSALRTVIPFGLKN